MLVEDAHVWEGGGAKSTLVGWGAELIAEIFADSEKVPQSLVEFLLCSDKLPGAFGYPKTEVDAMGASTILSEVAETEGGAAATRPVGRDITSVNGLTDEVASAGGIVETFAAAASVKIERPGGKSSSPRVRLAPAARSANILALNFASARSCTNA